MRKAIMLAILILAVGTVISIQGQTHVCNPFTFADVLLNDGDGSGLDADFLDGEHSGALYHLAGDTLGGPMFGDGNYVSNLNVYASQVWLEGGSNAVGDDAWIGIAIIDRVAGENLTQWEAVYLKSDGKWWLADANAPTLFPAVGIVTGSPLAGAAATVLVMGIARNDAWTWTPGATIWLSASVGALTATQPAADGDCNQRIATAISDDEILVNVCPNYTLFNRVMLGASDWISSSGTALVFTDN